jgi:GrpB-like predicted nucleotidyltransferase (UPF0157 family)
VTDPDPAWPRHYDDLARRIREALGWRVLQLEHVGSTAVPGLAAKPVIDIDLTVAGPGREQDYVPVLETAGFRLVIRELWWYGHRALAADEPRCHVHVFGSGSPEPLRHRIFRDWLRGNPSERARYAAAKRQAAARGQRGRRARLRQGAVAESNVNRRAPARRAAVRCGCGVRLRRRDRRADQVDLARSPGSAAFCAVLLMSAAYEQPGLRS